MHTTVVLDEHNRLPARGGGSKPYLARKGGCLQANLVSIAENWGAGQGEEQQLVEAEEMSRHEGSQEPRLRQLQEWMHGGEPQSPPLPPSASTPSSARPLPAPSPPTTALTLQLHQRLSVAFKNWVTRNSMRFPLKPGLDRYELVNNRSFVDPSRLRIC